MTVAWQTSSMRTNSEREKIFISRFLSGYENGAWTYRSEHRPDEVVRTRKAADWLAKRLSDGKTVAIEHTIIEPFSGDKRDVADFKIFLEIEKDRSLVVPGRWIRVFIPVGVLENRRTKIERDALVQGVHDWIKSNRLTLWDGESKHGCAVTGPSGGKPFEIILTVKNFRLPGKNGQVHIRRQQTFDDLGEVIERALRNKLTKLVSTPADRHVLLLERQHMILDPARITDEVEKRRALFPELSTVDEIWIVDASIYGTTFGNDYLGFMRYVDGKKVGEFHFYDQKLFFYQ